MFKKAIRYLYVFTFCWFVGLGTANAARIVIAADDWIFTNRGFSRLPADTANFATNVADFLAGGTGGAIHAYSNFQSLTQSSLVNTLNSAGYTYTTGTGINFDIDTLSGFDALFLGNPNLSSEQLGILMEYVDSGGGVYIHGGLGASNPGGTATAWNPFLNQYGLAFGTDITGRSGNVAVTSSHSIFDGVSALYMVNPHTITGCCVIATASDGAPLLAAVPIPAAFWLFVSGIAGIGLITQRKR
ncbi:MAG: hypothetical protein P8101_04755 [Candidatus Thiodiazotropha sp.]